MPAAGSVCASPPRGGRVPIMTPVGESRRRRSCARCRRAPSFDPREILQMMADAPIDETQTRALGCGCGVCCCYCGTTPDCCERTRDCGSCCDCGATSGTRAPSRSCLLLISGVCKRHCRERFMECSCKGRFSQKWVLGFMFPSRSDEKPNERRVRPKSDEMNTSVLPLCSARWPCERGKEIDPAPRA